MLALCLTLVSPSPAASAPDKRATSAARYLDGLLAPPRDAKVRRDAARLRRLASRQAGPNASLRFFESAGRARAAPGTAESPAPASPPTVPTCIRGNGYVPFTAPGGASDAGSHYPRVGSCRFTVRTPAGTPRGIVVQIASGGWLSDPRLVDRPDLLRQGTVFLNAGYQVVTVEHTSGYFLGDPANYGVPALVNLIQWYDLFGYVVKVFPEAYGPNRTVCVTGHSSGGHLALFLACFGRPQTRSNLG